YSNGTYTNIDDPLGIRFTEAHGINAAGQIVGDYRDANDANNVFHGFLYNPNGNTYTTIDDPLGTNGTIAQGINDFGQIVGYYVDSSNVPHAFLYSNGTYTTIDDPLGSNGTEANGINDNFQIVGNYDDSSGSHSFLAKMNPQAILSSVALTASFAK